MGFVGNYAPCGLPPQIDGMPVIPKKKDVSLAGVQRFIKKNDLKSARLLA
jgi:hypothetical protein